jgi:hypothetical protein
MIYTLKESLCYCITFTITYSMRILKDKVLVEKKCESKWLLLQCIRRGILQSSILQVSK